MSALDWPHDWIRWILYAAAASAFLVAVAFLVIAWRVRQKPLQSDSDWEPRPPIVPPIPPPAPAFVPAPPRPPTLSGPAAAALPIPRADADSELAELNRSLRELRKRQPVGVLRALPPPQPEPRDPGVVSLSERRRKKRP